MNGQLRSIVMTAMVFLLCATATPASEVTGCEDVKNTVRGAVAALQIYRSANGNYPEQLSATSFGSPDHVIVIYEKMNIDPSKEIFMVRAYGEDCTTMFVATPASPEPHGIPLTPEGVRNAGGNSATTAAGTAEEPSRLKPILVSTVTFFLVFLLIILVFLYRYRKTGPASEGKNESPPFPKDAE